MQSLFLKSSLPCGSNSATGKFVIVQGISNDFVSIPLHWAHLVSNLVSGPIERPMKGVPTWLENELAGGKVTINPKVVLELVTSTETEKIEEEPWYVSFVCCDPSTG